MICSLLFCAERKGGEGREEADYLEIEGMRTHNDEENGKNVHETLFKLLTGLKQQDRDLSEIEINEVLGFVGHVRAEVSSDNAVPGWVILFIEFLLDVRGNILRKAESVNVARRKEKGRAILFRCYISRGLGMHNQRHLAAYPQTYQHS
jgi:hypothetical protein